MSPPQSIVVIHYNEEGWMTVRVSGSTEDLAVLTVDDRMPHDRVYEHTEREDRTKLLELAPQPWGNREDDIAKSLKTKLHHAEHGLKVIE